MLAVYAHPDDETLQVGGLLALAAAQGRRVIVVHATRGELGEVIGAPELEGTEHVAPLRQTEAFDALAALGVTEHYWLDDLAGLGRSATVRWTDSGMVWVGPAMAGPVEDAAPTALVRGDLAAQADALARLIRGVRPAVVLCDEPGGAYGHPDHIRTHDLTMLAISRAAAAHRPDRWDVPVTAHAVLDEERLAVARDQADRAAIEEGTRDWKGWPLLPAPEGYPALARPSEAIDASIDVTSVMPQILIALRNYRSQVQCVRLPELDSARTPAIGLAALSPEQAAVGWYALSDGRVTPLYPVVDLEVARGRSEDLPFGPDAREARRETAPDPTGTANMLRRAGVGFALGVVAAVLGTLINRVRPWDVPLGMVLAAAIVVIAGLLVRALVKGSGLFGFGLAVIGVVQVLAMVTHGGSDVLIPGDALGTSWLLVSVAAVAVAAFAPRSWVGESRRASDLR